MDKFSKISKLVTLICALSTSVSEDMSLAKGRNDAKEIDSGNLKNENQVNVCDSGYRDSSTPTPTIYDKNNDFNDKKANELEDNKDIQKSDGEPSENVKKSLEIVFIIDKSGSMEHLKDTTVKSFNQMLERQKNLDTKSDAYVTTVLFSSDQKIIHDHQMINKVNNMAKEDYVPLGGTALLDALGTAINDMSRINEKNDKDVIFFIITDGEENSSSQFELTDIKRMIEAKKELGWKFVFLGANIDSFKVAGDIGIEKNNVRNFEASDVGMEECMAFCSDELDNCMS